MAITIAGLIGFVVLALIVALVAWVLYLIVNRAPMLDADLKNIISWVIFAAAALIILWGLLQAFGLVGGPAILIQSK